MLPHPPIPSSVEKKLPITVTSENIPELPSPTKTPVGADRRSPVLSSPVRTKSDSLDPKGMGSVREKWLEKITFEYLKYINYHNYRLLQ